jgi:hypothetical protein
MVLILQIKDFYMLLFRINLEQAIYVCVLLESYLRIISKQLNLDAIGANFYMRRNLERNKSELSCIFVTQTR